MVTVTRRTQAERRADMTAKLLDATAACLIELGYAGTTTTEVCRRAGVSRGAMLHHFPTKDELVAAAVAHIVDLRVEEFRVTLGALPPDTSVVARLETSIDVLWSIFRGPTVAAWLDLIVAARTDPQLRHHVNAVEARLDELTKQAWADLFPDHEVLPDGFYDTAPSFIFALLDGLAIHLMTDAPGAAERVDLVLLMVKLIVRTMATIDPQLIRDQLDALMGEVQ